MFGYGNWEIAYHNGNEERFITPIVKSVTWSGDIVQAYRTLEVELSNTLNGVTRAVNIEQGRRIRFIYKGEQLFTGLIFGTDIDINGQMSVTAYDENVYLTKNTDTRRFVKLTATAIIKRLCSDFGVPQGTMSDTGFVIPKLILRDKTLYDMMITALTETEKHTGKRFILYSWNGGLQLRERKEQVIQWVLENGVNIMSASYSQSIEDLKTQVKVIGGDQEKKPVIVTVKNDALKQRFGTMQHLENADADATKSQINQLAKQLLADLGTIADEANLECLGISNVISGKSVYIKESMTGIIGSYYVSADTHVFENGNHTMSVKLSATDDLPKMAYEAPKEGK